MEIKELKKFIDMIKETDIVELVWEKDGTKVGFKRNEEGILSSLEQDSIKANGQDSSRVLDESLPGNGSGDDGLIHVKSSMVGTFYLHPTPEHAPYIEEGTIIKKGQKIGVIEAMKIMKEIYSDVSGKVVKILVENGHAVEYGHDMFLVEPVRKQKEGGENV